MRKKQTEEFDLESEVNPQPGYEGGSEVAISEAVPAGSSSPGILPPSIVGTSQDPNRKE